MKKAKLAVVFPVYNGETTLERGLQCIADQDYADFQAYIVENRSEDRSLEIAREFSARDARFHVIECEDHRDAHGNLLRAMEIGRDRGEYFCLRPCDDLSTGDYLSKLLAGLEANPLKHLAVGSTERIGVNGTKEHRPDRATVDFHQNLLQGRVGETLYFPSEWFYGIYRSEGGADLLIRRWKAYGTPWCAASYCVAEFIIRGLTVWVDGPRFCFFEGSGSDKKYMVRSLKEKIKWRWKYTFGCYSSTNEMQYLSFFTRLKIFRMCWRDSGRKTRYRIRQHLRDTIFRVFDLGN